MVSMVSIGLIDWPQVIQSVIYFISLYYVVFLLIVLLETTEKKSKEPKEWPEVSIIIPAYNEKDNIVATLKSVVNLDYPKEKIKIIVVDDGSKDSTYDLAKEYLADVKKKFNYKEIVVLKQKNQGKHVAMNTALKHVDTEFFASLDSDSFPMRDSLKKIMCCFEDKKTAAVSSIVKIHKPKNNLQKIQSFEYAVNHYYKKLISKINSIHVLPGPMSVYRTKIIIRIGGFKEAHKTEDMEIAMRIQKNHYKIAQCNESFVNTKAPYKLKELYKQRHRWNYGSFRNTVDYSHMIFRKKYGDFGFFQLPMILISGIMGVVILGLILFDFLKFAKPTFKMLQMNNFNIFEYFNSMSINIIWLDFDFRAIITIIGFFALSLLIMWLSLRFYRERYSAKKTIPFVMYLFLYYLFLAIVWLGVFKDILLKRGTKWDKVS